MVVVVVVVLYIMTRLVSNKYPFNGTNMFYLEHECGGGVLWGDCTKNEDKYLGYHRLFWWLYLKNRPIKKNGLFVM